MTRFSSPLLPSLLQQCLERIGERPNSETDCLQIRSLAIASSQLSKGTSPERHFPYDFYFMEGDLFLQLFPAVQVDDVYECCGKVAALYPFLVHEILIGYLLKKISG